MTVKIDYVEFNVSNMEQTKSFYEQAFSWTYTDYGPDYCEFTDGVMKGGFDSSVPVSLGGPLIVLYSNDLDAVKEKINAAGGKITKEIFEFPGGKRFHFTDPDGYELAVWKKV